MWRKACQGVNDWEENMRGKETGQLPIQTIWGRDCKHSKLNSYPTKGKYRSVTFTQVMADSCVKCYASPKWVFECALCCGLTQQAAKYHTDIFLFSILTFQPLSTTPKALTAWLAWLIAACYIIMWNSPAK